MPKAKNKLSQKEQSKQFEKAAAELVEAGELDPIEGHIVMESTIQKGAKTKKIR